MTIPLSVRRRWERADAWARRHKAGAHTGCGAIGCSACCRSDVMSTRKEAEVLFAELTDAQREALQTSPRRRAALPRVPEPAQLTEEDTNRYWKPCVFLTPDKKCGAYRFRPALCRTYMVASAPEVCDAATYGPGEVAFIIDQELFVSVLPSPDHPDTGMLLDLLQEMADLEVP